MKTQRLSPVRGKAAGYWLAVLLAATGLFAGRGYAENTIDLGRVRSNQFPVRVAAVVFDAGGRMDEINAVGFGEWGVRFGRKTPSVYYHCDSPCLGSPPPALSLGGLVCESPDLGETGCRLTITLRDHRAYECVISGEKNDSVSIPIDCPISLETL
jgi:hypothetical protein